MKAQHSVEVRKASANAFAYFRWACLVRAKNRDSKPYEADAFACAESQHADGNHSRSWFDGGRCEWCGAREA